MRLFETFNKFLFFDFIGAKLNHIDFFIGARNKSVKKRFVCGEERICRVDDKFASGLFCQTRAGNRPVPGDFRNRQSAGGGKQGDESRVVLLVIIKERNYNFDIAPHSLVKKRPERPVNQPAGKYGVLRRSAFTPDKAGADDFSGRVKFFLVINDQREIIYFGPVFVPEHRGHQNRGLAVLAQNRAGCLFRQFGNRQV
jgi:hypothetical protein